MVIDLIRGVWAVVWTLVKLPVMVKASVQLDETQRGTVALLITAVHLFWEQTIINVFLNLHREITQNQLSSSGHTSLNGCASFYNCDSLATLQYQLLSYSYTVLISVPILLSFTYSHTQEEAESSKNNSLIHFSPSDYSRFVNVSASVPQLASFSHLTLFGSPLLRHHSPTSSVLGSREAMYLQGIR